MSSIFGLLNVGATGLHAHGFGMAVTSQNAQNATTEGYTRRDVRLSPIGPPPPGGGGVEVRGSRRVMDQLLERRLLGATSARAEARTRESALGVLDRILGEVEGGVAASLDDFEVAMAELVGRPSDPSVRGQVLATAERLSVAFGDASRQLAQQQADLDSQIEAEVGGINQQIRTVRDLGVAIQRAEVGGREASDLRDQRDQVLRELAGKLPITTVDDPDGGMSVMLGGSLSLVTADGHAAELGAQPDATTGRMTITRVTAGQAVDVTGLADSGVLGGLVAARDGALDDASTALDQLAFDIASAYNAAHAAGFGTDGVSGRNLFAPVVAVDGAAAAFAVSTDVAGQPDRIAAATDPALAAGDNRNAIAMAALADSDISLGGNGTAQEALGAMIGAAGQAIRGATLDTAVAEDSAAQLDALRQSVSGVSVDEEMMNLAKFQRSYQASLRVISAADEMLQQLVNLGEAVAMRVSDSMFNDLTAVNVGSRRQDVFEAQRVAQTGMKVDKPSDDPVAAAHARTTKSRERRAETVMKVSAEALDRFEAVDGVLNEVGSLLSRTRELATQGANDHLSADDRLDMAAEVSVLRQQLLSMANTRIEGEYVFGGMAVDREPFDAAGLFLGETTVRELELGPGVRLPTQVSGGEAFGASAGTSAFGTLEALEDALRQNDSDAIHSLLDDLDAVSAQVAYARASGGAAQQGLSQASAVADLVREEAIRRRADLTEADPVAAFTELVRAQGALRDALTIAQQLPPPSILSGG